MLIETQQAVHICTKEEQIIYLGCFLQAYLQIRGDILEKDAIGKIKGNYYFRQVTLLYSGFGPEQQGQYDKVFNNAAALITDSNSGYSAFEIYIERYMQSFSKKERQSKGKVYTPPEIVKWIHDKLEEQSTISLLKTYCDFAVGTGHFPFDWYDRLMKHWRGNRDQYPEIKDEHEAHRWIIERCLYFADIDPFAIRLCKMGLFLKDPEVAGLKFNSFVGDSLLDEPFGDKKFNYVAGNPPYVFSDNKSIEVYVEKFNLDGKGNLYPCFLQVFKERAVLGGVYGTVVPLPLWFGKNTLSVRKSLLCDKLIAMHNFSQSHNPFKDTGVTQAVTVFVINRIPSTEEDVIMFTRSSNGKTKTHMNQRKDIWPKCGEVLAGFTSSLELDIIRKTFALPKIKERYILRTGVLNLWAKSDKEHIASQGLPIIVGKMYSNFKIDISKTNKFLSPGAPRSKRAYGERGYKIFIQRLAGSGSYNMGRWIKAAYADEEVATCSNYHLLVRTLTNTTLSEIECMAVLAILNSRTFNYLYGLISADNNLHPQHLGEFPLPYFSDSDGASLKTYIQQGKIDSIDALVYKLYNFTEDEIRTIETALESKSS